MGKKIFKIAGVVIGTALVLTVLFYSWTYYKIQNGDLVKWEGVWYTKEELAEMFHPQEYNVPEKNTPEQVYAEFRQALLEGDIENALLKIQEEKRGEYRSAFEDAEKFEKWISSLPIEINNLRIETNSAFYDWNKNDGYKHTIDFIKNVNGYWEIDSI